MNTTETNETPKRRLEDRQPAATINWAAPGAPAVLASPATTRGTPLRAVASMSVSADGISFFATPAAYLLEHGHYMLPAPGAEFRPLVKDLPARLRRDHERGILQPHQAYQCDTCQAAGAPQLQAAATITNEQITAGAAVLGDDGKPVGRNTAIMVWEAMGGVQAAPAAIPEGSKLVPLEPTCKQLQVELSFYASGCQMGEIYRAMIAAAPAASPVAPEQDQAKAEHDNKDVEWLMQCAEEAQSHPEIASTIRAAARAAATKPARLDLSELVRYAPTDSTRHYADFTEGPMCERTTGDYVKLADVQSLLATKPNAELSGVMESCFKLALGALALRGHDEADRIGKQYRELAKAEAAATPAASAPPSTELKDAFAQALHYPGCWDTAAYPALSDALAAVYEDFKCSQCAPAASAPTVPEGWMLVPLVPNAEMVRAMSEDEWLWEDVLAAGGLITEDQYEIIATTPVAPAASADAVIEARDSGKQEAAYICLQEAENTNGDYRAACHACAAAIEQSRTQATKGGSND